MNKPAAAPVSVSERAHILDVLRGFALLGILAININGFTGHGYLSLEMKQALPTYESDILVGAVLAFLAEGKFYSIFSLLFGIGFSIILVRLESRGLNAMNVFYRRLFYLLLFGLAHILLLWEGDILVLYALLGMLLPLFIRSSNRSLLIWSVALILSPILIDLLRMVFDFRTGLWLEQIAMNIDEATGVPLDDGYRRYLFEEGSGWTEHRNWMTSGIFWRFQSILDSNRIPKVLGMFLLGYYAGRNGLFKNLSLHQPLYVKMLRWGLLLGVPANLLWIYVNWKQPWSPEVNLSDTILYALGVVPLAMAYVAALCLYWIRTGGSSFLMVLAPVGRMALTNYIMQTVLGVALFHGVGLGLGGYIGPSRYVLYVVLIYGFQVIYSYLWLKYFSYGPLEWLWRVLTYQKWIPIRREIKLT